MNTLRKCLICGKNLENTYKLRKYCKGICRKIADNNNNRRSLNRRAKHCIDCNKLIIFRAIRCRDCDFKDKIKRGVNNFRKGHKGYKAMLGRHHSIETKKKLFLANRGKKRKITQEHLENIRLAGKKRRTYIFKKCEVCQKDFKVSKGREKIARFCSCKCRAKKIMPKNPFLKGHITWNKGLTKNTNKIIRKMAENRIGEKNWMWRGDKVTYSSLHCWVRDHLGKPKKCIDCGSEKSIQWSNENGLYLRDLKDWKERCPKCNRLHDDKFKLNKARDKYPEIDKMFKTRYQR